MPTNEPTRRRWFQVGLALIPLVLAALPLPLYPFILLANVMSLAGEPPQPPRQIDLAQRIAGWGALYFLWGGVLYPLLYIYCVAQMMRWWKPRLGERS